MATSKSELRRAVTPAEKAFLDACEKGDFTTVDKLLSIGVSPYVYAEDGSSGLLLAASKNHPDIVRRLIDLNVDPNKPDENGDRALDIATANGYQDVVRALLDASGIDLNAKDSTGHTALDLLKNTPEYDNLRRLISHKGAQRSLSTRDKNLLSSIERGDLRTFENLVDITNINIQNDEGRTPLYLAVKNENYNIVEHLLAFDGIDVNRATTNTKDTPLIIASANGNTTIALALINHRGIDLNHENINKDTPLLYASANGHVEIVDALLRTKNVDINHANSNKTTPLIWSSSNGHLNVVRRLLQENGIDLNAKNDKGRSALHEAADQNHHAILQELVQKPGINLNIQDNDGNTPLHLAAKEAHLDSMKVLVSAKANINTLNKNGQTPLDLIPNTEENVELIRYMRDNGALTAEELSSRQNQQAPEQPPREVEIEVMRHQYGANKDEHSRAVNQAKTRIGRNGNSRTSRQQRAILGGKVGMQTANNNALANIIDMEEKGLLPKGPGGQSNAEVYLYRLQQARLFYSPDERLEMSDGTRQTADKALGSGDMTFRQVYDALINGQITDPEQLEQLARTIQITEGCINNRGQARTKPIIPVQGQSYSPGADRQVSTLRETLKHAAGQEITEYTANRDQGLQNAVAARFSGNDGRA